MGDERALQASEERYRALFEGLPVGLYRTTPDGRILDVNLALVKMLGYPDRETVLALKANDGYANPDDRAQWQALMEREGEVRDFEAQWRRRDGTIIWVKESARVVRDERGRVLFYEGSLEDITTRKQADLLIRAQRDLALALSAASDLQEGLRRCLETTITVSGMDRGGIHLVDEASGALDLVCHQALPPDFVVAVSHYECDSPHVQFIMAGQPVYTRYLDLGVPLSEAGRRQGLQAVAIVPIPHEGRVIGCLNLGSSTLNEIPSCARMALETIAAQMGSAIARLRAEEALRRSLKETDHSRRTLLALSQAAQAVQLARTAEEIYRAIGDEVARLGCQATIFTLTDEGRRLTLSYISLDSALLRAAEKLAGLSARGYSFPLVPGGFYHQIITKGGAFFSEPAVESIVEALPEPVRRLAGQLAACLSLKQAIYAPLRIGGEPLGLLTVFGADLTEADVPAVTAFANQTAIALEKARLFGQVQADRQRLASLSHRLVETQENELRHVARELHDEIGQTLTGLTFTLEGIARLSSNEAIRDRVAEAQALLQGLMGRVSRLSRDLRPTILDDLGLLPALVGHLKSYSEQTAVKVGFRHAGLEGRRFASEVETAAYRIVQEALTNVARHAGVSEAKVRAWTEEDVLAVQIEDQGASFDVEATLAANTSAGLTGMRERAMLVGGELTIESSPGVGTCVTARLPLHGKPIERGSHEHRDDRVS